MTKGFLPLSGKEEKKGLVRDRSSVAFQSME